MDIEKDVECKIIKRKEGEEDDEENGYREWNGKKFSYLFRYIHIRNISDNIQYTWRKN